MRIPVSLLPLLVALRLPAAEPETPADLGLTETTERRLVQVELLVDGPAERVARLLPSDLDVKVAGSPIDHFYLDVGCAGGLKADPEVGTPAVRSLQGSVALYLDQSHLVPAGRVHALASAGQVAASLIEAGHRVRLVSDGLRLKRLTPWTHDLSVVQSALRSLAEGPPDPLANPWEGVHLSRLIADAEHLDAMERSLEHNGGTLAEMFALPETNVSQYEKPRPGVTQSPDSGGFARSRPGTRKEVELLTSEHGSERPLRVCLDRDFDRILQDLEYAVTRALDADEDSFERLSGFLLEMEGVPGPKAVVLYADTLRRHAGAALSDTLRESHAFQSLLNRCPQRQSGRAGFGSRPGLQRDASLTIDEVLHQASARRVRLHTVLSQGLTTDNVSHAEALLADLALETGGRAFRGAGTEPLRVAEAVVRDVACPVLLSLEPETFQAGRLLSLRVKSKVEGIEVRAPGLVFSETPEQWKQSQWLATALQADGEPDDPPVTVGLIPLGMEGKRYLALAQVVAPAVPRRTPRWELEAYGFPEQGATQDAAASVTARPAGVPAVLEATMRMTAGSSDLVGVARDAETDDVGAMRRQDTWPNLRTSRAGLSPLTMVQPAIGGFVRDGKTRRAGALVVSPEQGPDPRRSLAFVGLGCRGKGERGSLVLERTLHGAKAYPFDAIVLDVPPQECAQFRDSVPAGSLTAGTYRYSARLVAGSEVLAEQAVAFEVRD